MARPSDEPMRTALLVAANRAALYGTVARWVMHDLRGPAQALSLVSDLLEQGDTLEESAVRASLTEASGLLRELLDLLDQVLRRPAPDDEPRPIVPRDPIRLAVRLLRLYRSNVTLQADQALEARLPAVRAVDDQLQHALMNVLVNAYEALGRKGGGTVCMTAETSGAVVRITVTDDGPGVAPDIVERLFEPFVTTKTGSPLAGLGLGVARALLERSGGTLRYEPVSSGSRFVLELPVWV
jgi:signal transduction histidine kinase